MTTEFPQTSPKSRNIFVAVFLAFILIGNALYLHYNAFRCFNFIDMGSVLDASWRIFKGQKPYVDFIYWPSPFHLYMNVLFFKIFGVGKTAMFFHLIIIHSLVILITFFLLFRRVPLPLACLATLLTVPSYYWSISHPWHDQNGHFWGILGIAIFLWTRSKTKYRWGVGFLCGILTVLSIFTKMNLGGVYGLLFVVLFLFSTSRKALFGGFAVGILMGFACMWWLIGFPKEYFEQFSQLIGTEGEKRLTNLLSWKNWLINGYYLPFVLVLFNGWKGMKADRELWVIFFGMTFIGIFSSNTGGMIPEANNILWGIQMALAFLVLFPEVPNEKMLWQKNLRKVSIVGLVCLTIFLTVVSMSYGQKLLVWTYIRHNPVGDYTLKTEPFRGWNCAHVYGELIDEMAPFIKKYVPQQDSLLIIPTVSILYMMTDRDPYHGVPYLFLDNVLPAPGKQTEQVRNRILTHPPDWLLLDMGSVQTTLPYLNLKEEIGKIYRPVKQWKFFFLLKKR